MKKLINGKRYDTDTARELATWDNGEYGSIEYVQETLYRKQTGEYFLHGEGGAASKYAKPSGVSNWAYGERIMPLSTEDARAWAEEHLSAEKHEEIFGAVEEDTGKRTVTFSLTESAIEKIAQLAAEQKISKSEVIERLLK